MRDERARLLDILEAVQAIARYIGGRTEDQFRDDEVLRDAVLHRLSVIGESAAHLPSSFRDAHPQIPWAQIVRFRNFVVHVYFAVNWRIVWTTATKEAPELGKQVAAILATEFP